MSSRSPSPPPLAAPRRAGLRQEGLQELVVDLHAALGAQLEKIGVQQPFGLAAAEAVLNVALLRRELRRFGGRARQDAKKDESSGHGDRRPCLALRSRKHGGRERGGVANLRYRAARPELRRGLDLGFVPRRERGERRAGGDFPGGRSELLLRLLFPALGLGVLGDLRLELLERRDTRRALFGGFDERGTPRGRDRVLRNLSDLQRPGGLGGALVRSA